MPSTASEAWKSSETAATRAMSAGSQPGEDAHEELCGEVEEAGGPRRVCRGGGGGGGGEAARAAARRGKHREEKKKQRETEILLQKEVEAMALWHVGDVRCVCRCTSNISESCAITWSPTQINSLNQKSRSGGIKMTQRDNETLPGA